VSSARFRARKPTREHDLSNLKHRFQLKHVDEVAIIFLRLIINVTESRFVKGA
jgi:hypothetical protein